MLSDSFVFTTYAFASTHHSKDRVTTLKTLQKMVAPTRSARSTRARRNVNYDTNTVLSDDESTRDFDTGDDVIDIDSEEDYTSNTSQNHRKNAGRKRTARSKSQRKRPQPSKAGKGKSKLLASTVDEIEDYEENHIFQSLSNGEYNPGELAKLWFDDYINDDLNVKFEALKDFLNFMLRCSGCIIQLSRHDVTNTDNAKETVSEIQTMFARQKYHEFPMVYTTIGKNNEWKEFPTNALSFISSIVLIASESGVLYEEDDQYLDLLLEWIGSLSTSNIRALRYVATVFGLNIQSVLCKLSVNISKYIDKFLKQLKKENDSLKNLIENEKKKNNRQLKRQVDSANERIKVIEDNLELYKKQKKLIDNYINDFFNTLFAHRYRDVSNEIRLQCVIYLGEWMEEYPELFTESFYLRYLGWLLTDQDANIRSEVFKVLIKLYKKRNSISSLSQFTSYFKHKLIEIVIYETDFGARYNCLQLLNEVIEKGYLLDDDMIKITSLAFVDDEDLVYPFQGSKLNPGKFLKEISKFISKVEGNITSEVIEQNELDFEKINEVLPFDSKSFLKLKSLMKIMMDSYEYYLSTYEKSDLKSNKWNCKNEKFSKVFQNLYSLKRYNDNNEIYLVAISYLTFDFSSLNIHDKSTDIITELEIDSKIQLYLMHFINAATTIYIEGVDNSFYKQLFPYQRTKPSVTVETEKDAAFYISKLLSMLYETTFYFHDDIEQINVLVNTVYQLLHNKTSNALQMNESNINGLKKTIEEFMRLFSVINFPLCPQGGHYNVKYYNSITYQFSLLLKEINVEEFELNSAMTSAFNETSITMMTKLENKSSTIIESINKLHILNNSSILDINVSGKLSNILPIYAKSLQTIVSGGSEEGCEIQIKLPINNDEFHAFLQISSDYITNVLHRMFLNKAKTGQDSDSSMIIQAINEIQYELSQLCDPILFSENTMTIDNIHCSADAFIENTLTISAFLAEYSLLNPSGFNISMLRFKFTESMIMKLLKLYCIREYQFASLIGIDNKLDRDAEEDVNFNIYEIQDKNDESLIKYETLLCDIAAKLILSCKLHIIDDSNLLQKVERRVDLNKEVLLNDEHSGELYRRVMTGVGILTNTDEESGSIEKGGKKRKVQGKLTDMVKIKKRKLIEEEEEDDDEEEDEDEHGEDENDPIEYSSSEEEGEGESDILEKEDGTTERTADDSEMVFSEIEEGEDGDDDNGRSSARQGGTFSSEIGSLASSFPFTQ